MTDTDDLTTRVRALLLETEAGPRLDEKPIVEEVMRRHGSTPPDPIPDFWVIADRYGQASMQPHADQG